MFDSFRNFNKRVKKIFFLIYSVLEKLKMDSGLCDPILNNSKKLSSISIIESIVMSLISVIFDYLYKLLSQFEVHNDSNDTKNSLVKKLFFWKYFTTAIIPIFSAAYIPVLSDNGFYDEITPYWFKEKGAAIMISSIMRIFILALVGLVRYAIPRLIIFYDTSFTFDRNKTRKTNHQDYEIVYTTDEFDLELSYAEAFTTIFLAFTYGFFMPLIFVTSYLQLFALYARDKLLSKFFIFIF